MRTILSPFHTLIAGLLLLLITGPASADRLEQKREKIRTMRATVLDKLYQENPNLRNEIERAAGYAVFSNVGVNALFFSAAGGNGVARNNRNGRETFMNMAAAGVGLGLGIRDFRAVFVFHTPRAYRKFIDYGFDFSGQADAAAKSSDRGDGTSVAVSALSAVSVYQLTETGIALQATLQGTKYWASPRLN